MKGRRIALVLVVTSALAAFGTNPVQAQSGNQIAAEALFREARKLLDAGQFKEACEKLEASRKLEAAPGTLLNLARCREKLGQTATAWAKYREAIRVAKAAGQTDREKTARERADMLEPILPRLTIVVSVDARADKIRVKRDGIDVPEELWGVTVPVDPGEHSVEATAATKKPWTVKASVQERAQLTITVPQLEPSAPPYHSNSDASGSRPTFDALSSTSTARVADTQQKSGSPANVSDREAGSWNAGRTMAVVLGVIGVAGLTVSTLEWIQFEEKKDAAAAICPSAGCYATEHAQALTYRNQASSARTIAIAGAAIGGASLVAAGVLWFSSGSKAGSARGLQVAPVVGANGLGFSLNGAL